MGQYFKLCLLNSKKKSYPNKNKIAAYLKSWDFDNGAKLMEFSYIGNEFVNALEELINKEHGKFAGYPVIVAGDYADEEPYKLNNEKVNIYQLANDEALKITPDYFNEEPKHYRYIINEDKKVFFDTKNVMVFDETHYDGKTIQWQIHPLTILCSDGCNGGETRGGGDYCRKHREVGAWRRNVVVVSDNKPDKREYREVFYNFKYC